MENPHDRNAFDAGLPKRADACPNPPRKTYTVRSGLLPLAAILPTMVVPQAAEFRKRKGTRLCGNPMKSLWPGKCSMIL